MDQIDTSIDKKQITINSITYKEINDISADML